MKRLPFLLLLLASAARPQTDDSGAKITADRLIREGPILRAAGHVRATSGGVLLTGDSGSLNTETDDIEVLGHARVVLPPRSDRNLIRYNSGALASAQEVVITAERLSVKSGLLLRGRGHVEAVIRESRLEADEIDVFLKIGDGEVRGNIRLDGEVPQRPDRRGFRQPFRFPPEIWK
jgi:lipopolysaccharide assembly outer membrane protein LptD (OstA)